MNVDGWTKLACGCHAEWTGSEWKVAASAFTCDHKQGDHVDGAPPAAMRCSVSRSENADDLLAVTFQCLTCEGDGYYERWIEDAQGRDYPVAMPCDICGGTGELRAGGEDDPE